MYLGRLEAITYIALCLLQLQMKADDGKDLKLEEYVQQIQCRGCLGVLELVLFMRMMASMCEDVLPQLNCQIWQGADTQPMVLRYAPAEATPSSSSLPAVGLKLVSLPQSKSLVWLPVTRADGTHVGSANAVQQQLEALDSRIAAQAQTEAEVKQPPAKPKQEPKPEPKSAFKRRLRSYNKSQTVQPPQPAESSASVLHCGKRGPSPDNNSATGKPRRI